MRGRGLPAVVGVVLVMVVAVGAFGSAVLPSPNLTGGSMVEVPLSALLPLIGAVGLLYALGRARPEYERAAARPVVLFDAIAIVGIATAVVVIAMIVSRAGIGADTSIAGARNFVGYLGLGLLAHRIDVRFGGLLPAAFVLGAITFGVGRTGEPRSFAWPLIEAQSTHATLAFAIAVGLLVIGVGATCVVPPKRAAR